MGVTPRPRGGEAERIRSPRVLKALEPTWRTVRSLRTLSVSGFTRAVFSVTHILVSILYS